MKTVILNADNRVIRKHDDQPDDVVVGEGETAMGVDDLSQAPMHYVWNGSEFVADAVTGTIAAERHANSLTTDSESLAERVGAIEEILGVQNENP